MAFLIGPNPSRRDFLRTAALSAGAALAAGCTRLPLGRRRPAKTTRWAIMADTHISRDPNSENRGFRIADNFRTAVGQIIKAGPQGAVICGDVARLEGLEADYAMMRDLIEPLRSAMPVALILGNHDNRVNFLKAFPNHPGVSAGLKGKHIHVIEIDAANVRLVMLDSLLFVNQVAGFLGGLQLQWLADYLDRHERRPTFLFFHHTFGGRTTDPGKNMGHFLTRDGDLLDTYHFFDLILPRKQVKAVFYGHSHVFAYDQIKGLHLINIPAIGYSFNNDQPMGWVEARLSAEGGEFTLHAFASNTKIDGQTRSLSWRG